MPAVDWREAAAYAPLLGADRSAFAWEWLRRSADYRSGYAGGGSPAAFGLVCLERPELPVWQALPVWRAELDEAVLRCRAVDGADRLNLGALGWPVKLVAGTGVTHVLIGDGLRGVRIDVTGPVCDPFVPRWSLMGMTGLDAPLAALDRLRNLSLGRSPRGKPATGNLRRVAVLRVHDALVAGASYREIAAVLFGEHVIGPRWWLDTPYWGLRVSRLAAASRAALVAGPRPWLCRGSPASDPPAH